MHKLSPFLFLNNPVISSSQREFDQAFEELFITSAYLIWEAILINKHSTVNSKMG